jgi:hypothetical protein
MNASISRLIAIGLVAIGLVAGLTGTSHAQFTLYDNFDGGIIDPEKWFGFSTEGPSGAPAAEAIRIVDQGRLRLALTSYGGTTSDAGTVFSRQAVSMKQLGEPGGTGFITGVKAQVTILAAKAQGCSTNPESSPGTRARATSSGNYFNDGSSTGPSDGTGDIGGFLQFQRDNDGGKRIVAGLFRCTNATCGTSTTLVSTGFTATWTLNAPQQFKIVWQQDEGKIRFVVNNEVKDVFYPAGLVVAGPPVLNFKNLRVDNTVENCTSGRKKAAMDVLFENVQVRRQP